MSPCLPSASVISPAVLSFSPITAASVSAWGDESTAEFSATVPLSETTLKKHSDHWVYKRSSPSHKTPSSPRFQQRNDKNTGPSKICSALFLGDGTLVPNEAMTLLDQAQNWRITATIWQPVSWVREDLNPACTVHTTWAEAGRARRPSTEQLRPYPSWLSLSTMLYIWIMLPPPVNMWESPQSTNACSSLISHQTAAKKRALKSCRTGANMGNSLKSIKSNKTQGRQKETQRF